jgi:hypothetical protein
VSAHKPHEPVQREAVDAEWRIFKDALKTAFAGIKAKKEALLYQQNIAKAQVMSNSINQAWKEIML